MNFLNEKERAFNYFAFVLFKIIILLTVKYPLKVQDRPTNFNGGEEEMFVHWCGFRFHTAINL